MEKKENPHEALNDNDSSIGGSNEIIEGNDINILSKNGNFSTIDGIIDSDSADNSTLGKRFI